MRTWLVLLSLAGCSATTDRAQDVRLNAIWRGGLQSVPVVPCTVGAVDSGKFPAPDYFPIGVSAFRGAWVELGPQPYRVSIVGDTRADWIIELAFSNGAIFDEPFGGPIRRLMRVDKRTCRVHAAYEERAGEISELAIASGNVARESALSIESLRPWLSVCTYEARAMEHVEFVDSQGTRADSTTERVFWSIPVPPDGTHCHETQFRSAIHGVPDLLIRRERRIASSCNSPEGMDTYSLAAQPEAGSLSINGKVVDVVRIGYLATRVEGDRGGLINVTLTRNPIIAALSPAVMTAPSLGVILNEQSRFPFEIDFIRVVAFGSDAIAWDGWPRCLVMATN